VTELITKSFTAAVSACQANGQGDYNQDQAGTKRDDSQRKLHSATPLVTMSFRIPRLRSFFFNNEIVTKSTSQLSSSVLPKSMINVGQSLFLLVFRIQKPESQQAQTTFLHAVSSPRLSSQDDFVIKPKSFLH
jgi:hypothetical protein